MKLLAAKLLLFLGLLLAGQVGLANLYPGEVPEEILTFEQYLRDGVDILYFGDSTLWYPRGSQTIPQMLQELLPEATIGEVSHAAYSLDVYARYVAALAREPQRPKLVILPINLRSFSPEWDRRPGYQFMQEKTVLTYGMMAARLFGKPYAVLGGYQSPISDEDFRQTTVFSGTQPVGLVKDFEAELGNALALNEGRERFIYVQAPLAEEQMKDTLIYYYMYELQPAHRQLNAMLEIVDTLQGYGIDLIFYITPVNVELGDVYVGDVFRRQVGRNTSLIRALLSERGVSLLDLSFDLAAFNFSDTEHLRQNGKSYVASRLAAQIASEVAGTKPGPTTPTPVRTPTPLLPAATARTTAKPQATPANPLLATAQARATIAAGGSLERPVSAQTPVPGN